MVEQYKTVLVLVGVVVLIVAIGYLLFQFAMSFFAGGRPDPSTLATPVAPVVAPSPPGIGSPVPGGSPSPAPGGGTVIQPGASPSPAAAAPGVKLKVVNTEGQGANMRQRPSTAAPIVRTLPEGTSVEAIGDPTTAEGRTWRNVRDPNGATGWIATDLLAPE
jgi:hypothetical protein